MNVKDENTFDIPSQIIDFENKWSEKNPNRLPGYCHNVYHLVSEDMDGNITNEMFGINVMTDYGFKQLYMNNDSNGWNNDGMFIGSGQSIPITGSSTLESPITNDSATVTDRSPSHWYTRYYPENGIMTSRYRICIGYFDYTKFSEDKEITEIGIGRSISTLFYHARVYDSEGNPSSFTKKMNERLTITVYITCHSKYGDIINKAWNKGLYIMYKNYALFKPQCGSDYMSYYYAIHMANHNRVVVENYIWYSYVPALYDNDNKTITKTIDSLGSIYIEDKRHYISDIFMTNVSYYSEADNSFFSLFKPKLDTPEFIQYDYLFTNRWDNSSFSDMFGMPYYTDSDRFRVAYGMIPALDFDISGENSGMWMYNCQDHDFTIPEEFVNAKDCDYDTRWLRHSCYMHGYIEFLNKYSWYRAYLNHRPDIPITKFEGITGLSLYATDSYWDTSTWEIIPNISNVPEHLQTKRYYCILGNTPRTDGGYVYPQYYLMHSNNQNIPITVTRQQTYHSIIPKTQAHYCDYGRIESRDRSKTDWRYTDGINVSGKVVTNDEYGYVATMDWLVYPYTVDPEPTNGPDAIKSTEGFWYRYRIYGVENDYAHQAFIWNTTIGDKLIVQGNTSWRKGFRIYSINKDPSIVPTYQDLLFETQWGDNPHWSFSNNGFVALSYIGGTANVNITHILDIYGDDTNGNTPCVRTLEGYHHAHIIDISDYICGVNADVIDHTSLDIIDMRTLEIVDTIDIPEGYTFNGMCGWKNFIYIRVNLNGAFSTYVYYISQKKLVLTSLNLPNMVINNDSWYKHIQRAVDSNCNCESCMVLLGSNGANTVDTAYHHRVFKESDPENPIRIYDNDYPESWRHNGGLCNSNISNQSAQLRYSNDGKQLLLAITGARKMIVDIGFIMDKGMQTHSVCDHFWNYDPPGQGPVIAIFRGQAIIIMPYEAQKIYDWDNGHIYKIRMYCNTYPIENFIPHRIAGYTRTINSFNNPKQIGGIKNFKLQYTNDVTRYTPPSNEE